MEKTYTQATLNLDKAASEQSPQNEHLVHDGGEKVGRVYTFFDHVLIKIDQCLQSLSNTLTPTSSRPNPAKDLPEPILSAAEQKHSAGLMRVNHAGEVCAQALYLGQSLTARDPKISEALRQAAQEEIDHLQWCETRLQELNSHRSYLNSLWFIGSLTIGTFAGLIGDRWSLGFLAETEEQVFQHLSRHLKKLPKQDLKSEAIILTMREEERQHATTAIHLGAAILPPPIKFTMRLTSKIMTSITYYI